MIIILSPAKRLDFDNTSAIKSHTQPQMADQSKELIKKLRTLSLKKISDLMDLSPELTQLNFERYHNWHWPFSLENAKQTILAFQGDVYKKLDAQSMNEKQLAFAQEHLRILSGLYGVLRPLDLIQAYRLEMGTKLQTSQGKNLYEYWGDSLTENINSILETQSTKVLINLASNEYFKAVKPKNIDVPIITPVFKDFKNGRYKVLSLYAKYARGLMTRFIIKNKIDKPEKLKLFDAEGYAFDSNLSSETEWVFTR